MNSIYKKYLEKLKNPRVLIVIGIIGLGLIFLSSLGTGDEKASKISEDFTAEVLFHNLLDSVFHSLFLSIL